MEELEILDVTHPEATGRADLEEGTPVILNPLEIAFRYG